MIARRSALLLLLLHGAWAAAADLSTRVEAKSKSYLAVGVVQSDRMVVRLSRLADNAPVTDAGLRVALRAITLDATAETDGSYSVHSPQLATPGPALIAFLVTRAGSVEKLVGTLEGTTAKESAVASGSARQLWWWVLNFGVCIGFLMLYSRRKKQAPAED